jgi:hypothetical protein
LAYLSVIIGSQEAVAENADIMLAIKKWYENHLHHMPLPNGKTALVTGQGCSSSGNEAPLD